MARDARHGTDGPTPAEALAAVHEVLATGARAPAAEVLAALAVLRHVRDEIAEWEPRLIAAARARGVSWAELAPALGVTSRQAAERRYLRTRASEGGETTAEERVQAERDRRAGDRAVAAWARENSAALRTLAGQVGALDDVPHARTVHRALAHDDAALLLGPLADVLRHLTGTHAPLAAQIEVVVTHTTTLRRTTHERRRAR
jgi:hypothetical protein